MNKNFINFILLLIYQHKSKHIAIFIISSFISFLLISTIFISSSIKHQLLSFSDAQSDFVLWQIKSGKKELIPHSWIDDYRDIKGVSLIQGRVYGKYYHLASDYSFIIIGIDIFDDFATKQIENTFKNIDISEFISKDYMLIGSGVNDFFQTNHYKQYYNFLTPELDIKRVDIFDVLPQNSGIISNDVVIMDINLARQILGIPNDMYTDLTLNVPNDTSWQNIKVDLIDKHHNIKIVTKDDLQKEYLNLYNYKSGFFLMLFIILLLTFCLILYQRYSMINSSDKIEIAILRSTGWSIKDVVLLKVSESGIIGLFSFLVALILAYVFVFFIQAPFLKEFFLGSHNITHSVEFVPFIEVSSVISIFLFFISFFIASVLVPSWKIAASDIDKALR